MRRIVGMALAAITLIAMGSTGAEAQTDCALKKIAEAKLTLDGLRPLVPVQLNGVEKVLLLDTNATLGEVAHRVQVDMDLSTKPAVGVVSSSQINEVAKARSLKIGALELTDHFFLVRLPEFDGWPWDGSLGPDILRRYDVDLDLGAGILALYSQDHCPGNEVYWKHGTNDLAIVPFETDKFGRIFVRAIVDGKSVYAAIDTGSSITTMKYKTATDIFRFSARDPGVDQTGRRELQKLPFKELSIGGIAIQDAQIFLCPPEFLCGSDLKDAPMEVGISELEAFHVFIAYSEKKLYLTPASPRTN
jgi:hypothetical protein